MGLHKINDSSKIASWMFWLIPLGYIGCSIIVMLNGDAGKELLRYDRVWIGQGESWRLLSAHLTHLGWSHLALNSVGLLLVWYLVGATYQMSAWIRIILVSLATIDIAFWFLNPELYWYVGMSGLLHGLLIAGIVARFRTPNLETVVLLALVVAKIAFEQINGPVPGSEATSGGSVVVDAHLYGAIGGLVAALIEWSLSKIRAVSQASI